MPNVGGLSERKRALLANVVHSIILYAALIWIGGLKIKKHKQRVASTQRKIALRVASTYRTTSTEAALVIAGMIPLHLLAEERETIYLGDAEGGITKQREEEILEKW